MKRFSCLPLLAAAAWLAVAQAPAAAVTAGDSVDRVRAAGTLACGLVADEDDYSEADHHGDLTQFGADQCRALAAVLLGDPARVRLVTLPDEPDGLAAVRDGKVDVLFGATPNPAIATAYRVRFAAPIFYDGQGFLASPASGITHLAQLASRHVCFINASPPEQLLYDALDPALPHPTAHFPYTERGEMVDAFAGNHCDAITGDASWMANVRAGLRARGADPVLLPETISVDPLSPVVREGEPGLAAVLDWTQWALLQAEAHGVTRANVGEMRASTDPVARRLAGGSPWIGRALGVADDGFARAIAAVGNAGEIYERDVGSGSPLALPRGRNRLATDGGLMWALPIEPLQ